MKTLIALALLTQVAFCQKGFTGKDTTWETIYGTPYMVVLPYVNGFIEGTKLVYCKGTILYCTAEYKKGMQTGDDILYNPDGGVRKVFPFWNGTYHGAVTTYKPNGLMDHKDWYFYGLRMPKEEFDEAVAADNY